MNYTNMRNKYSKILFEKNENELDDNQNQLLTKFIYEARNPIWKTIQTEYGSLEINHTGTVIRDPVTKIEFRISYVVCDNKPWYPIANVKDSNGRWHIEAIHRLVGKAFVDNPDNKPEINHIDGNKRNSFYQNLEWVTSAENNKHSSDNFLMPRGQDRWNAICTDDQIHAVCKLLKENTHMTFKQIGLEVGVPAYVVHDVYELRYWTHISDQYKPFPKRDISLKGEDNPANKYSSDQIYAACIMLYNHPELSFVEIGNQLNMPQWIIGKLHRKEIWNDIVDQFEFPKRDAYVSNNGENNPSSKYTNEQIELVCNYLDKVAMGDKLSYGYISQNTGVSKSVIKSIKLGRTWTSISSSHYFYKCRKDA